MQLLGLASSVPSRGQRPPKIGGTMLNKTILKFVFAMLVAASFTVIAEADTVYNYTGNAMTCTGGPCPANPVTLTGSVTFAQPLNPNLFFSTAPNAAPNSYDFVVTGGSFTSQ